MIVNFEGKIYEKEIVKVGGFKYLAKTFSLPDVQPGCIIEYQYKTQWDPDFYENIQWTVQSDLFTRLAKFSVTPDTRDGAPPLYWREYRIPGATKPEKQKNGTITMDVRNLEGLEEEDYMPPKNFLLARVAFFYRNANDPLNETPEQFWKRMGKGWDEQMEKYIDRKKELQEVVSQTVSPNDPPEVKLQRLYARVQQIHNIAFDQSQTEKEEKREKLKDNNNVEDVLKHGYGNPRQINLVMIGLARAAGFEASRAWIAPRSNNAFYSNMEGTTQLSADVVWIKVGSQDVYVDPAAKFYGYPYLPWYESGVQGLRLEKGGKSDIAIPLSPASDSVRERRTDVHLDTDGTLSGNLEITFFRQWGSVIREDERDDDDAGKKKDMADSVKAYLPAGATFEITGMSGWDKNSDPVHIEGTVRIPGFATAAGHHVLLPLTLFQATQPASFQHEKRLNSIYFHFPEIEKDSVTIHLPSGWKIESIPTAQKASPGGGLSYSVSSSQSGDVVSVDRELTISGIMFPVDDYRPIRAFFNKVKTDDDAQIVLQLGQMAKGN
jgi:transglutaminase-like putative cysteine protease